MEFRKIFWAIRGVSCKLFFGSFGNKSYIGKPISLIGTKKIFVGNRVRIYPGVRMEVHNDAKIIINENTSIGQNFHIVAGNQDLIIDKNNTISGNVFITNIDHSYQDINKHILDQECSTKTTKIGEGCFIGYGAVILAGTTLGKHCIVGSNSVVRGVFPDYSVIVGAPGRTVKRYNPITNVWDRIDD